MHESPEDDLISLSFTNYWDYMHMHYISTDVDFEKEKTLILVDKKFKQQRDRITRRVNKTFPKIKSVKKQLGKR